MAFTYDFSQLKDKLSELLGDSDTATDSQFPLTSRERAINEAEVAFSIDSKNLLEKATGTVASMEIDFPSDLFTFPISK